MHNKIFFKLIFEWTNYMKYFLSYIKKCQTGTYFFWLSVLLADNDPILLIIV